MSEKKLKKTSDSDAARLNKIISKSLKNLRPPEGYSLSEWADHFRQLSSESSAEAGRWRTARTPYLKEVMDSFTDPAIHHIVMVAASQVGKSEFELNAIGYCIDQDPGSILYIQPTIEDARDFSRLRIEPMLRDTKRLDKKVNDVKERGKASDTVLQKSFPGGILTLGGSNSPSKLASKPIRYLFGDERDRWSRSAGREGDPWELAKRRTQTFYNRKIVEVSTPTIKGDSAIAKSFELGTQEYWCVKCPECDEYENIVFEDIRFDHEVTTVEGKRVYTVGDDIRWVCPRCGSVISEDKVRKQPFKWIARNPKALESGVRSFWLNAFVSPWTPWKRICEEFLNAKDDPEKLKVVYNTLFGQLWENRGDIVEEDELMAKREEYGLGVDIPDGVYVLTCGVDTQDNRFEYEIVGWGVNGESWGIKKGIIMGRPNEASTQQRLTDVIDHVYRYKSGVGLKISITFIDSGGHYTQDVYEYCRKMFRHNVFAIKGKSADGVPFIQPPSKVAIGGNKRRKCYLYTIGVDSGKTIIMDSLSVQTPGPKYCHFPKDDGKGYDSYYFSTLLSENLILKKTDRGNRWIWEKIPGHERNEGLDCRNYALAALRVLNPEMDAVKKRFNERMGIKPKREEASEKVQTVKKSPKRRKRSSQPSFDW